MTFPRPAGLLLLFLALGLAVPAAAGADVPVPWTVTAPPAVVTTDTSAQFSMSIVPGPLPTQWTIQYGATTSYGQTTPAATVEPGMVPVPVTTTIGGLSADGTYHFRLAISAGAVTMYTDDATFATQTAAIGVDDGDLDPVVDTGTTQAEGSIPGPTATVTIAATPAPAATPTPAPVAHAPSSPTTPASPTPATACRRVTVVSRLRATVKRPSRVTASTPLTITARASGRLTIDGHTVKAQASAKLHRLGPSVLPLGRHTLRVGSGRSAARVVVTAAACR